MGWEEKKKEIFEYVYQRDEYFRGFDVTAVCLTRPTRTLLSSIFYKRST